MNRRPLLTLVLAAAISTACQMTDPPANPQTNRPSSPSSSSSAPAPVEGHGLDAAVVDPPEASAPDVPRGANPIQRTIAEHFAPIRACYDAGLKRHPSLEGTIITRLTIDTTGHVAKAVSVEPNAHLPPLHDATPRFTTMPDAEVTRCVLGVFSSLTFPAPAGGDLTVDYPLEFGAAP